MTTAQRRKQRRQHYLDNPNVLTRPATPRQVNREEKAAARTKFGPATKDLHAQARASGQQQRNISSWYDQYKADLAQSYSRTAAGYQQAAQEITGARDSATAADTQAQQQNAEAAQQSAARRGAIVDTSLTQRAQQATAANAASSNRDLASLSAVGAAQGSYAAGKIPVAQGQAIQAHQQESGRRRTIATALKDIHQQKADFKVNYRSQARKDATNAAIAKQAGLLQRDKLNADIADKQADNARADIQARETALHDRALEAASFANADAHTVSANASRKAANTARALANFQRKHHLPPYGKSEAENRAARRDAAQLANHTGPYAKPKSKTPYSAATTRTAHDQFDFALAQLRATPAGKKPNELVDLLVGAHVGRLVARAAVEKQLYGHITAATRLKLKNRLGLKLGGPTVGRGTH